MTRRYGDATDLHNASAVYQATVDRRIRQAGKRQFPKTAPSGDAERYDRKSVQSRKNRPLQPGVCDSPFRRNLQQLRRRRCFFGETEKCELARSDQNRRLVAHIHPHSNDRFCDPRQLSRRDKAVSGHNSKMHIFRSNAAQDSLICLNARPNRDNRWNPDL